MSRDFLRKKNCNNNRRTFQQAEQKIEIKEERGVPLSEFIIGEGDVTPLLFTLMSATNFSPDFLK